MNYYMQGKFHNANLLGKALILLFPGTMHRLILTTEQKAVMRKYAALARMFSRNNAGKSYRESHNIVAHNYNKNRYWFMKEAEHI